MKAAHVDSDTLHSMIVSGRQWPSAGTEESYRQLLLRTRNVAMVGRNFRTSGILPVLDEVVATAEQLDLIEREMADGCLTVVLLAAPPEVILRRDSGRAKHTAANYVGVQEMVFDALRGRAAVIDTADLSPDQTVDAVVRLLPWELDGAGARDG